MPKTKILTFCALSLACLLAGRSLADGVMTDPLAIGVGARPLGMGKAYVAVAEDADAIFVNPAGLAHSANPKLTTMYASLMGDVSYQVIGGVYPLGEKMAVGAGMVGASVDGINLTDSSGNALGTGSWSDRVFFLSIASYLSQFGPKFDADVLVGANLKYFSSGGSGVSGVADSGSTFGLDLGLLWPVNSRLMMGLNMQNAVGGNISRAASTDLVQRTLKLGAKIKLLGSDDAQPLVWDDSRKLYCTADYDHNYKTVDTAHFGIEFWPTGNLALRAGLDDRDPTAGLGLRVSGLEFNYAYHPYSSGGDDTTHYFSLGYLGEARQREIRIALDEPKDKSVIYEDHVTVKGKVEYKDGEAPKGPVSLKVNGAGAAVNPDGSFTADVPVGNFGRKLIKIEAADPASGASAVSEARVLRLTSFADVPEGYWAKQPIENNATVGLVQGYPDGNFKPERSLTRAELATLLVRAKGLALADSGADQVFKDVKPDFWAAAYIAAAQRAGLINGYPDRTFRPNNYVNKAEGIAILARFDNLELAEVASPPYWDVPADHWAAKYIQSAKSAGMLGFVEDNRLRPAEALARSESVEMLGKTSLANSKIQGLFSWDKI